jgi:hypothetical protein
MTYSSHQNFLSHGRLETSRDGSKIRLLKHPTLGIRRDVLHWRTRGHIMLLTPQWRVSHSHPEGYLFSPQQKLSLHEQGNINSLSVCESRCWHKQHRDCRTRNREIKFSDRKCLWTAFWDSSSNFLEFLARASSEKVIFTNRHWSKFSQSSVRSFLYWRCCESSGVSARDVRPRPIWVLQPFVRLHWISIEESVCEDAKWGGGSSVVLSEIGNIETGES